MFLRFLIILFFCVNLFSYEFKLNPKDTNLINNSKQKTAILKRLEKYKEFKIKAKSLDIDKKLAQTNFFINRTLPEYDSQSVGIDDYWMTPKEFFFKGFGDCEDYAISKYFTLLELGIKKEHLYLAIVSVKGSAGTHMVLLYIKDKNSSPLVLDNLSFKVLPFTKRVDLTPIVAFNEIDSYQFTKDKFTQKVVIDWQNDNKWERILNRVYKLGE
ncbi:transglutaminase-like cysteine peptidase [Aliarcobacter vitoriensis]|uniref:transglutaminase-like cysteine peptidase n=1 Tax=Aliarcobacter vitoriensis TaxID=2011099 RepID=UPI003AAF3169